MIIFYLFCFQLWYNTYEKYKELNTMQNMQKNYKGKHLKKNQLKRAQMAGKKIVRNKVVKG